MSDIVTFMILCYNVDMDLTAQLKEFGLSQREATIYTTLLQLGDGSILDIARNSGLKRPTVYTSIESLESMGLIHRILHGKRVHFKPEQPQTLQLLLQQKQKNLATLIPQLEAITNVPRGTKPEIRYFEGKEAVISLYQQTFFQIQEKDEVYLFSSIRDLLTNFSELMTVFDKQAIKWKWKVREILPNTAASLQYLNENKRSVQKNPRHNTRLLPKGLDLFDVEILLLKNSIVLVSIQKNIFAVVIKSPNFIASFRSIFQATWLISTK